MKKAFFQRATEYLAAQKLEFLRNVIGTELEQAAITHAIDAAWILPMEPLDCVTTDKLFPSADLFNVARRIDNEVIGESEGSRNIRDAVRKDSAANMEAIKAVAVKMQDKLTHARLPESDSISGIPVPMSKNTFVLLGFRVDGKDVYLFQDSALMLNEAVDKKLPVTINTMRSQWHIATSITLPDATIHSV